jgi:hypothetical protein
VRRLALLLLVAALLPGCAMFHRCPAGEDCSYVFTGVMATATFADPWNATVGEAGVRAAGFPATHTSMPDGNGTYVMASDAAGMPGAMAGPYPAGGSALTLYFHAPPGSAMSHAEVAAQANATWPTLRAQAEAALARYENATGWRHVGGLVVAPIEGIT